MSNYDLCDLCGQEIILGFKWHDDEVGLMMSRNGTLILREGEYARYHPNVKYIPYNQAKEILTVHRKCRQRMRLYDYVKKKYGYI